jgi:hypothetical protein
MILMRSPSRGNIAEHHGWKVQGDVSLCCLKNKDSEHAILYDNSTSIIQQIPLQPVYTNICQGRKQIWHIAGEM